MAFGNVPLSAAPVVTSTAAPAPGTLGQHVRTIKKEGRDELC